MQLTLSLAFSPASFTTLEKNGYRAKCFSCNDLANGIAWVLEDEQRWQALSHRAKEKVEQEFTFEIGVVA